MYPQQKKKVEIGIRLGRSYFYNINIFEIFNNSMFMYTNIGIYYPLTLN